MGSKWGVGDRLPYQLANVRGTLMKIKMMKTKEAPNGNYCIEIRATG